MIPADQRQDGRARRGTAPRRRFAAVAALLAGTATLLTVLASVIRDPTAGLLAGAGMGLVVAVVWQAALQTGWPRRALLTLATAVVAAILADLARAGLFWSLSVVLAGVAVTAGCVGVAFGHRGSAGGAWEHVPAARRPVLLINPRSGDGAAERVGLPDAARTLGIEPVLLGPGDDLAAVARVAAGRADVIGMAGGDGSQAVVAAVAAALGLPFVCIPAGTRNHFALDLGIRRSDLLGALEAFTDGVEARVDLGTVNGRTFVNNVSFGVYGQAVQDPDYRQAKVRTLLRAVGTLVGSGGSEPRLRLVDDLGTQHESAAMILVSNNPYALDRALGRTTRPRLDGARLGVILVGASGRVSRTWNSPALTITASGPTPTGIDGEAVLLQPPLLLRTEPARLTVRIAAGHPGVSPSGLLPPTLRVVVPRLWRLARG